MDRKPLGIAVIAAVQRVLSGGLSGTGPSTGTWYTVSADSTEGADTCAVPAAAGRTLVGSVAGLGSKPILRLTWENWSRHDS